VDSGGVSGRLPARTAAAGDRSRHGELEGGSRIGARYRHTTPEMATRVIQALDRRLTLALKVAEEITPAESDRSDRMF
jgi:hypothetical protein